MKLRQSSVKDVKVDGETQRPTASNVAPIKSMTGIAEAANAISGVRAAAMAELKVEGLDLKVCTNRFAHGAFSDVCSSWSEHTQMRLFSTKRYLLKKHVRPEDGRNL